MTTTRATRFIRAAAQRCVNGQVTVEFDRGYSTVAIDASGVDCVFMQGDEAAGQLAYRRAVQQSAVVAA